MIAGPSALAIALCLIPGWLYWKFEGSPRTARSALAETFEVLVGSAATLGLASLAYLGIQSHWQTPLADPAALVADGTNVDIWRRIWSFTSVLGAACLMAIAGASLQRWWRERSHGRSSYDADTPLWASALGGRKEPVVSIQVKGGERYTGYLGGFEVTQQGATPPILLLPPIEVERRIPIGPRGRESRTSRLYRADNIVIPGPEIVSVWIANDEE